MSADAFNVALVVPGQSPAGIYGPSCLASGELAADEINASGGVLGRELRLRQVDGGRSPAEVAAELHQLVGAGRIDAVTGWHTSAVRQRVAAAIRGRVPYVYTAVYEGGESTPGVFLTGETPRYQVLPALRWLVSELGIRDWYVVGDDYVWPRTSAAVVRRHAGDHGARLLGQTFVPVGTEDFTDVLAGIRRTGAQGVLMFLLGSDAVHFNRAFAAAGLDDTLVRFSPLMDENMLLATGVGNSRELYSAAGFFETMATSESMDFERRYIGRHGVTAPPLTGPGESCYEGLTLLARMMEQAGSSQVGPLSAAAETMVYESPRGVMRMEHNHLRQQVLLARADDVEYDVLATITPG